MTGARAGGSVVASVATPKTEEQKAIRAVVCPECGSACIFIQARSRKNHRYLKAHLRRVVAWRTWQMAQDLA